MKAVKIIIVVGVVIIIALLLQHAVNLFKPVKEKGYWQQRYETDVPRLLAKDQDHVKKIEQLTDRAYNSEKKVEELKGDLTESDQSWNAKLKKAKQSPTVERILELDTIYQQVKIACDSIAGEAEKAFRTIDTLKIEYGERIAERDTIIKIQDGTIGELKTEVKKGKLKAFLKGFGVGFVSGFTSKSLLGSKAKD